ncbi:terminase family protein [Streptomyces sp. ET3-23]|uniref:terminase large subunit domain-containing protein n=1 Tax=Streptomyces sp. ET3-23 TaxID=2885643 RepID=UPI001D12966A|nr:terminase family protein [Streptomyces sp. ET3-23]MCC2280271.1 terminase family protein [Streptomyces sp. ET3-23]
MNRIAHMVRLAADPVEIFARALPRRAEPEPWQVDVLRGFPDGGGSGTLISGPGSVNRLMLVASRQTGKTSTTAALLAHRMITDLGPDGRGCLCVALAPTLRTAVELLGKVRVHLAAIGVEFAQDSAMALSLTGLGSRCVALPGTPVSARGWSSVSLAAIDEAAFVDQLAYQALRPTLINSGGDLVMLTSAGHEGSWAHGIWAGDSQGWTKVSVPWHACPRFAARPEEINELRASMPKHVFESEMECRWGSPGAQVFDAAAVTAALRDASDIDLPTIVPLSASAA